MKWNGIVSQLGHRAIAATFAAANANHPISTDLRRRLGGGVRLKWRRLGGADLRTPGLFTGVRLK